MLVQAGKSVCFKSIAVIIAATFLWSQAACAGDLIDGMINKQANEQAQLFAPLYLQGQQAFNESRVVQKQDIENFSQAVLTKPVPSPEQITPNIIGPRGGSDRLAVQPLVNGILEVPVYEYDDRGRIIKSTYSNGDFILISYYGDTTDKYQEVSFKNDTGWQYSVEYYEGTNVIHYMWISDINALNEGDETYREFDDKERLIYQELDNYDVNVISYYGDTPDRYQKRYFRYGWLWKSSLQYYADGITVSDRWISQDFAAEHDNEVYHHYDEVGRSTFRQFTDGNIIATSYYGATANKYQEVHLGAGGIWLYSLQYHGDGANVSDLWVSASAAASYNNEIYHHYDEAGRTTFRQFADGNIITTSYYGATRNKYQEVYLNAGLGWQHSVEYYEDGTTIHKMWLADADPSSPGNIVYREYNPDGDPIIEVSDTGNGTTITYEYAYTYYASGLPESRTTSIPDGKGNVYYHYLNEDWNGQGHGRADRSKSLVPINGAFAYSGPGELTYFGELSYTYTYYNDATGRLKTKMAYSDDNWTRWIVTYTYYNDEINRIASKIDPSDTTWTYYNDPSGRMESKSRTIPDVYEYYHYMNENWNGMGHGRIDKSIAASGWVDDPNAEIAFVYTYYDGTTRIREKRSYSDFKWTNLLATYNYYDDESSRIKSKTDAATGRIYTYFNDSTAYIETVTYSDPGLSVRKDVYLNENWNNRGYGRLGKSANIGGNSYSYDYYDDTSDRLKSINEYSDDNWTISSNIYEYENSETNNTTSTRDDYYGVTYTYYGDGLIESITTDNTHIGRNTYGVQTLHLIDENWNNQRYGRVDTSTWTVDSLLVATYTYIYDDNSGCPYKDIHDVYYDGVVLLYLYIFGGSGIRTRVSDAVLEGYGECYPDGSNITRRWYEGIFYEYWLDGTYYGQTRWSSIIAGTTSGWYYSQGVAQGSELQQQASDSNSSTDPLPGGGIDDQKEGIDKLNQRPDWYKEGEEIDLSHFRSFDDLQTGLAEKYGDNSKLLEQLSVAANNLKEFLKERYSGINVSGDISVGVTLGGPTPDGGIESSTFSGESFIGNADVPPWLGVYNNKDGFCDIDISVKNGNTVEATITTRTGMSTFNRTVISSDLAESRADMGSYTHGYRAGLDFTTSTFVGSRPDGAYFGMGYDTLSSISCAKTSTENLVFIPREVVRGERQPITVNEQYGKLLYDIYNNGKTSLNQAEVNIIQTQTYIIVQNNLQNVPGITLSDINAIYNSQLTNIINMTRWGTTVFIMNINE
jgi:hypothetical protein